MIIYFIEDKDTLDTSELKIIDSLDESFEWRKILRSCSITLWDEDGYVWDNIDKDGGRYVEYIIDTERYTESDVSELLKMLNIMDNSKYWWTPEEKGLTQADIDAKVEELWSERLTEPGRSCPDCSAAKGEVHMTGCDVARCTVCKGQALSCNCEDTEAKWSDKWSGIWPGIKECYELKLITWSDPNRLGGTGWMFDLNTLAKIRSEVNQSKKS